MEREGAGTLQRHRLKNERNRTSTRWDAVKCSDDGAGSTCGVLYASTMKCRLTQTASSSVGEGAVLSLTFSLLFFLFFPLLEPKESNIFISHRSRIWVMIHSHAVQITPSPPYSPNSLFIENSKMKGHCFILSMGSIHEIRFELSKKASKNILCM